MKAKHLYKHGIMIGSFLSPKIDYLNDTITDQFIIIGTEYSFTVKTFYFQKCFLKILTGMKLYVQIHFEIKTLFKKNVIYEQHANSITDALILTRVTS